MSRLERAAGSGGAGSERRNETMKMNEKATEVDSDKDKHTLTHIPGAEDREQKSNE